MQRNYSTSIATTLPLQCLIDERYNISRFSRSKTFGHSDFPGQRISTRRGQGIEFTDLRQYADGDDVRHIDWNVTARSNEAYTRLYREEREHTTTVVVDLRPCMFTGSHCLRSVAAGRLAAAILWQACDAGDRCAALVYSTRGQYHSRPIAGQRGTLQACELIASEFSVMGTNQAAGITGHESSDLPLSAVLDKFNRPGRSGGTHYFISGFDTKDDRLWDKRLAEAGAAKKTIGIMLLDPLESTALPNGRYAYSNNRHDGYFTATRRNSSAVVETMQREIDDTIAKFESHAVPLVLASTDHSSSSLIAQLQLRSLI